MDGITVVVDRRHGYTGAMRDLPRSIAKEIARSEYWPAILDQMDYKVAFEVFDAVRSQVSPRHLNGYRGQ